jgi:hypothetical protein
VKKSCLTVFKTLSPDEQMEEITRGLVEVERVNKEIKEARILEEIRLKEEAERKSIQDEQIRNQQEKELQGKLKRS